MRGILVALAATFVMATTLPARADAAATTAAPAISSSASAPVFALQSPPKSIDINISTNNGGGVRWYKNPVWIAIMAVGGVVVLLLLVLIARGGGGTTIIKE